MHFAIRQRRNRPIENVLKRMSPRPWIARILVNGRKQDAFVSRNDRFGTIAVMGVKVPDGDTLAPVTKGVQGCNRNRVQVTKAHSLSSFGMMPWRSEKRKSRLTLPSRLHRQQSTAGRATRMLIDLRIVGRIQIKIDRLTQP